MEGRNGRDRNLFHGATLWPQHRHGHVCRSDGGRRLKIATYNVNGVIGRLDVLLRWLKEDSPISSACRN